MTEIEKVIYTAESNTSDGREGGVSRSSDGRCMLNSRVPAPPVTATNPEELFAAGRALYKRDEDCGRQNEGGPPC